jgi:hypothetical protein
MAEVIPIMFICAGCTVYTIIRKMNEKSPFQKYREMQIKAIAKAYADRQEKIIQEQLIEEEMNKLSIYEQEVIKEVLEELAVDNYENMKIEGKMEAKIRADEEKIRADNFKIMMENTPEYKEMLKKYKR